MLTVGCFCMYVNTIQTARHLHLEMFLPTARATERLGCKSTAQSSDSSSQRGRSNSCPKHCGVGVALRARRHRVGSDSMDSEVYNGWGSRSRLASRETSN